MKKIDSWSIRDGVIGNVINTVRRAQEIAMACIHLYGEDSAYQLHSNFISMHRTQKEVKILGVIGKKS